MSEALVRFARVVMFDYAAGQLAKSDDVVIPKDVEARTRAIHPPELHDEKLEEARTYYRVLREDRRAELRAQKAPTQIDPVEVQPTKVQQQRIQAHKRRKKTPRKRKVRIYPQQGSSKIAPKSTHEEGMWQRHMEHKAMADAKATPVAKSLQLR